MSGDGGPDVNAIVPTFDEQTVIDIRCAALAAAVRVTPSEYAAIEVAARFETWILRGLSAGDRS